MAQHVCHGPLAPQLQRGGEGPWVDAERTVWLCHSLETPIFRNSQFRTASRPAPHPFQERLSLCWWAEVRVSSSSLGREGLSGPFLSQRAEEMRMRERSFYPPGQETNLWPRASQSLASKRGCHRNIPGHRAQCPGLGRHAGAMRIIFHHRNEVTWYKMNEGCPGPGSGL